MQSFAVISDIHGSMDDLACVMMQINTMGIQNVICLGDIIGKGGESESCWNLVRGRCTRILAGNHDMAASGREWEVSFLEEDQNAIDEAYAALSGDERYMNLEAQDTFHLAGEEIALYHASPIDPVWEFIDTPLDAEAAFSAESARLILFGHTHRAVWIADNMESSGRDAYGSYGSVWYQKDPQSSPRLDFKPGVRYLLNPGSVIHKGEFMVVDEKGVSWHKA